MATAGETPRPEVLADVRVAKLAALAAKASFQSLQAAFLRRQREPQDDLRHREYGYLEGGAVHLDHADEPLAPERLLRHLRAQLEPPALLGGAFESSRAVEARARARQAVLDFVGASAGQYEVVFAPSATAAAKLVAESYPFGGSGGLLLSADLHNDVGGMRAFARAQGAQVSYVPLDPESMRLRADKLRAALAAQGPRRRRFGGRWLSSAPGGFLFAFPGLSSFTGALHPLALVADAQRWGWDVFVDATLFAATSPLDLGQVAPDFVLLSLSQLLGHPVGLGCLVVRKPALARLRRPWFAGGSAAAVSVACRECALREGAPGFEDGAPDVRGLEAVAVGFEHLRTLDRPRVRRHLGRLTSWLLEMAGALRHGNGAPVVRVIGPADLDARGPVLSMELLAPHGRPFDPFEVQRLAATAGIRLGAGWFDNPGAFEAAFGVEAGAAAWAFAGRPPPSFEAYAAALGVPPGVVRVSLGPASSFQDVFSLLAFLRGLIDRPTLLGPRPAKERPALPSRPSPLDPP